MRVTASCKVCGGEAQSRCSGCFSVAYCRAECQKSDWPSHKPDCTKPYTVKENDKVGRWKRSIPIERRHWFLLCLDTWLLQGTLPQGTSFSEKRLLWLVQALNSPKQSALAVQLPCWRLGISAPFAKVHFAARIVKNTRHMWMSASRFNIFWVLWKIVLTLYYLLNISDL